MVNPSIGMDSVERTEESAEQLRKEAEESIERVRWDFERLAEWIIAHRTPTNIESPLKDKASRRRS
jgi:hypothetical protein